MSNDNEKTVEDMSLGDDVKHPEPLDMDLNGPDISNLGVRIAKLFPDADIIDMIDDFKITRMADSSYTIKGKPLSEVAKMDLKKLDNFLREKEGKK